MSSSQSLPIFHALILLLAMRMNDVAGRILDKAGAFDVRAMIMMAFAIGLIAFVLGRPIKVHPHD